MSQRAADPTDPRQAGKALYPLPGILLLALCGTLSGAENFVDIARWGRRRLGFLRRLLPFERGIASPNPTNELQAIPLSDGGQFLPNIWAKSAVGAQSPQYLVV